MPKQLNVSLAFTADTAQAKRQIQELQQSLAKLSSDTIKNNIGSKMTEDLQKSVVAANQLKDMLQQAVNPNTGNLDLSRFSEQLKASGKDIQSYARDLNNLGPEGTKTFMQLAQSIASAEVPMRRSNALMKEFGVTLMNAARWQFSSSVLHGLMGAIQGAYSYAQSLDESLTNIAIVTGRSRDEMAQFAEQANKSAQALSASTTAYTDAALIYYQQGLGDAEVQERTDATIKLANVTGQSAEHISSYMTAIWNNFEDGAHSIEYYADVITSLGAHTASSSEEIARGMQQFASVADTVGLSYEYAASALATIVAQTRQSETSVGNGLRTIFARFDSLKMGETIDDDVDLTKYTEALQKVGVSVLDQNGNLKDMNSILDEIGERWQNLNETQKTALATTVGGVRQYSNLMALFDNWDQFQENVGVARDSEGSLNAQADTYAESWEAAQKRVKAAWQAIYQDLIDSDFFIGLLNTIEKVLQGVDTLIDGMGGLSGVLGVVGAIITTVFADNLAKGIQNAVYNFKVFTGQAQDEADALAMKFKEVADQMGQDLQSPTATAEVGVLKDQIDFALKLRQASDSITAANKQQLLSLNEITKQYGAAYVEAVKLKEAAEGAKSDATYKARDLVGEMVPSDQRQSARESMSKILSTETLNEDIADYQEQAAGIENFSKALENAGTNYKDYIEVLYDGIDVYDEVINHTDGLGDHVLNVIEILEDGTKTDQEKQAALKELGQAFREAGQSTDGLAESVRDRVSSAIAELGEKLGLSTQQIQELQRAGKAVADTAVDLAIKTEQADNAQANYTERLKQAEIEFENLKGKISDYSTTIVTCARGMSQLWAAFSSLGRILDTLKDKDLTWAEKLQKIIPSLLTALPMLINGIRTLTGVQGTLFSGLSAAIKVFTLALGSGATAGQIFSAVMTQVGVSLAHTLITLGPFIAGAAILGATIWGLVEAFKAWKASTPEGQLEAAKSRLEEASTAAEEAATAYDDLKSSLNEYRQTREDINNIEDSEERTRAINEENDKILEMLENVENWHDLIGDLKYDNNGLISLTDEQLKALENDKAREASLAKQLELQEKINVNTANEAVEDNNYSGKKIVAKVETLGGADNNIKQYQKQDITAEIADFLAERGLGAKSEDSKIREALESSEKYDESQIDQIIEGINAIESDQASLRQFGEMQTNHLQTMAMNDALEKQQNQLAIDTAQRDMGDKLSLDSFSKFEDVQAQIANEWNLLSEETKEAVRNNTMTLQEAFGDRLNIEQANNEALQKEKEEHDKWREQNVNSVADKVSFSTYGKDENGNYVDNTADKIDSEFSDEDLKIAATLELDKYKSIEELKAAIAEVKAQTEQDRLFQIEMKKAEDAGLDMDEWQRYFDYLQNVNEELAKNDVLTAQIATANMRLNKGVASLIDDFDDWRKTLDTINESGDEWAKHSLEYADSMTGIQEALADISNLDLDTIRSFGEDFVTDNLDLIQEAAYGDADAIDELIKKIAEAQAMKLDIPVDAEINREQFDADRQALIDAIYDTNFEDIEINSSINDAPFYEALQKMVADGALAANDINAFLASIGYSPIVDYVDVPIDDDHVSFDSATGEYTAHDDEGNTYTLSADAVVQNSASEKGLLHIPIIQGSNANGGIGTIATSGATGTMASALASGASRFTGGTGAQTSAANRNGGAANRPKGSSGCFAAGTLVTVDNHYENIENVKVGDIVLSYNEKTKKNESSEVVQTMIHFVHEKIYNLFIKNDKLIVTGNHKFLITHNGTQEWKQAADIQIGDLVLLANGTLCEISNIDIETKFLTVYNFEVSNTHNYYVGENQILAHNKGGGGKGSGSGKEREKKKEKDLEEKKKEEDRYHDLEEVIEDVDTALDRLDKSKDRAFGKNKINLMNLEIKKFKEQIGLTKKYIDEIKKYQKVDRDALEQKLKDIGMSQAEIAKQFDANGVLTSYEDLFSKLQDHFNNTALKDLNKAREEYNAKVREWNAGGLDEDSWKEVEENLKEAEEIYKEQESIYKEQLDALKQYEDTTNLLQEKQQELIDQMNDLFDKALDIAREKIEIQLDVNDRDLKHLQWLYENIGDDADKVADRIANLSKQAEISVKNIKTNADGIRNIFSGLQEAYDGTDGKKLIDFSGINLDLDISNPEALINTVNQVVERMKSVGAEADIQTFLEDITKYEDSLMEEYRNLSDINEQITENMRDAFDDWRDQLEKNLDTNDHIQDLLESYQDIADLLGQEHMGISDEEMQQWRKSQLEIQRDAAEISKANWEAAKIARQKAKEEYDAAIASGNQLAIEQAKAMLEEAEDFEKDAHKEYLERVAETLRTAEEMYEESLVANEKAYQKALSGGLFPTLDRLQEQLDMQKELNHLHLDDYEKYKKLGDLQVNINKQLANNPNVKVQGKLKDLMDDVNKKMEAGAEISEGEATILEKRLMLLQAEDQLMAARNAKSAVRMTRDNEGNFSYTYTADTSKIEEAQQNYADKFYDLLDYERKYSEDTQAAILQSYKEFLDKRNDIINDESLTDSERKALLNQLEKDMKAKVQFYTDEMKMVLGEMSRLKTDDWGDIQALLSGRPLAEADDFETSFEDTVLAKVAPAWKEAGDGLKSFVDAAKELKSSDFSAMDTLAELNNTSMERVGSSTIAFGQELVGIYDKLEQGSEDVKQSAIEMADEVIPKYDEMIEKGKEFSEKYGDYYSAVAENIDKVVTAIEKLRKSLAGVEDVEDITTIFEDALGGDMSPVATVIAAAAVAPDSTQGISRTSSGGGGGSSGKTKNASLTPYDNVYNAIVDAYNNGELEQDLFNTYLKSLGAINYLPLLGLDQQELLQNVHIEAAFPNVESHAEIEQAVYNLVNSASQYVNRGS